MEPSQQRIAGKLRNQFRQLDQNPQQLLREFQRYKELVRRPTITKELIAERETLLGQLITFVRQVNEDFNSCTGKGGKDRIPKGKNNPEVVNNIIYVKQLEAKIDETKMNCLVQICFRLMRQR
uniref:Uncharacterized protein n=1 Tax=Biomphalaria glabrata TaxID=6526 RepID=A0A2C9KFK1_BIOGL